MKDLIKVRIDKAEKEGYWYKDMIGHTVSVEESNKWDWKLLGSNSLPIAKSCCTVLEGEKEEPKEFVLPEKWCVKGYCEEVIQYSNINGVMPPYHINASFWHHFPAFNGGDGEDDLYTSAHFIHEAYTEITKEQFFTHVWEKYFGKPHEIPSPEPKGYCIRRTPENAEVLNKWANGKGDEQELTGTDGYIHSCFYENGILFNTHFNRGIKEGFTELHTVEDFFEKVNYKPEPVLEEQVKEESERIPFDLGKWESGKYDVVQRNGLPAQILKTDLKCDENLVVVQGGEDGSESIQSRLGNGRVMFYLDSPYDLFLIPKTETVWVNVYYGLTTSTTKEEAYVSRDKGSYSGKKYIETIEVKRPIKD